MNRQGFTLLELLVLVAVLGILVAAVIANMNRSKARAFDVVALSCAQDIQRKEKIAQLSGGFVEYSELPGLTACKRLEEIRATPEGDAAPLHYVYFMRHPKGTREYAVTDSDIYANGVSASGKDLADDPSEVFFAGGPGGGGGGPSDPAGRDACAAAAVGYPTTWVEGSLGGVVTKTEFNSVNPTGVEVVRLERIAPNAFLKTTFYDGSSLVIATTTNLSYGISGLWETSVTAAGSGYASVHGTMTLAEYLALAEQETGGSAASAAQTEEAASNFLPPVTPYCDTGVPI